ncbi:MAG: undecaprenyldiphospho-muramoylpentapeptide beta-N-acetylglucosaminyltransferase [Lachnospiraceae bacterium]|nr:undecaprenyldiphospho-muramoylpentapeptide beta-N-acetylglucosaminyltransferase [Lachnospiraceae bacterium]
MSKIILTGGGTAGHVTPNIALIPALKEAGFEISYIGSYNGMEKELIQNEKIPYYGISTGKLRRYLDPKNITDPFRVIRGLDQSIALMKKLKPDVVFSKGGFVSVPVMLAAREQRIPAILHESDMTPGLANKIAMRGATKVCCNFPETEQYLPEGKAVVTGTPIRRELMEGRKEAALEFTGLSDKKPILLIMGGSLGSVFVNNAVRASLDTLLKDFSIIHLCGKGNLSAECEGTKDYVQYEYISKELPDLFAAADIIISRAGANAICELLALRKPNILIPLSKNASRGDQILNARSFEKQGFSYCIEEEDVTAETLTSAVTNVFAEKDKYIANMAKSTGADSIKTIVDLLQEVKKS